MGSIGTGASAGAANKKLSNRLDKAGFKDEGNGEWTLDTGLGGAQILDESQGPAGQYGRVKAYTVRAWDSNYNIVLDFSTYPTLNEAKKAAKKAIKSTI